MRFVFTLGRMTVFDFSLFRIDEAEKDADVVVVHHQYTDGDEEDKPDSGDIFGGRS